MTTQVHISVEEYLQTSFRPDCDYVEGEVQERNLGEQWHGLIQSMIAAIFKVRRHEWGLRSITEQRIEVAPNRFRIPDVCVVRSDEPLTGVLRTAPLLCVEVLSPEDRFSRTLERVQEYTRMGVPHVWIIDPISREIWTVAGAGGPVPLSTGDLLLPGTPVGIAVADIFAELDEAPQGT